jgi:RNA polymerase-binding transcription factor DksA
VKTKVKTKLRSKPKQKMIEKTLSGKYSKTTGTIKPQALAISQKNGALRNSSLKKKVEVPKKPLQTFTKYTNKAAGTTHLSAKQLTHFEDLLLTTKLKILHNIDSIESQNLGSHKDSSGDLSGYSLHMADVGTDNYDRELSLNVAGNEQNIIYQIDEALDRIKIGSYGICVMSGDSIPIIRLEAIPWTAYSKEAQEKIEKEKKARS